jgi:hypothetical protein
VPRIALMLSLPALALGVAACGDQTADLEKTVNEAIQRGYPDAKVECPSDVNTDKGSQFTCTVTGIPSVTKVTYEVADDDGNVKEVPAK